MRLGESIKWAAGVRVIAAQPKDVSLGRDADTCSSALAEMPKSATSNITQSLAGRAADLDAAAAASSPTRHAASPRHATIPIR